MNLREWQKLTIEEQEILLNIFKRLYYAKKGEK